MASRKELQDELNLLKQIEAKRNDIIGQEVKGAFESMSLQNVIDEFKTIDRAVAGVRSRFRAVNAEVRDLTDGVTDFKDLTEAITAEFGRVDTTLTKVARSYRKINGIANQLTDINLDLVNSSTKDVQKLKEKSKLEFKRLKALTTRAQIELDLKKAELKGETDVDKAAKLEDEIIQMEALVAATQDQAKAEEEGIIAFENVAKRLSNINKIAGIGTGLIAGLGKALSKVGFDGLASAFEKGADAARELSVEIEEAIEEGKFNRFNQFLLRSAGSIAALGQGIRTTLAAGLSQLFSPQGLLVGGIAGAIKLFNHLDHSVSEVGKTLGVSSESARQLTFELKDQALASGELFINMDRLVGAQLEISRSLGSNVQLTAQQLEDQTYLAEFAGLQGDQLVRAYKTSLLMGKSQEAMFDSVVKTNDSIFTATELFGEAMNTTGQIAVNLGNNPEAIAKAVGEAKRLGINLDTARSMADSTLDFESSISAEMEAQVLTGKALNLNHARELAFRGDHMGAAKEMLKQVGSLNEFQNMNVIAQKSLAQAMGLSVDELANQLTEAEANEKIEARINQLKADGLSLDEATLKARDENRTVGEAINDIVIKLKDLFGGLVKGPLNAFRNVLMNSDEILGAIKSGFAEAGGFAKKMFAPIDGSEKSLAMAVPTVESIKKGFTTVAKFAGKAVNFIASIPGKIKDLKEDPFIKAITGFLGSTGGKITLAAGGIGAAMMGVMGAMRGSNPNLPIFARIVKGGALVDGLKNILKRKGTQTLAKQAGQKGAGAVMKATGKMVYGAAATSAVKAGTASIAKTGGKSVAKQAAKLGAKAAGKTLLKKIPLIGALAGAGFALQRAMAGDYAGAALELTSGVASTIPGIGTAVSLAADAALVARDINRAKKLNELQQTVDSPTAPVAPQTAPQTVPQTLPQEVTAGDVTIRTLPEDTLAFAGGTQFGKETNDLLRQLIAAVNQGGDVIMDGNKVGSTLSLASYKL